MRRYDKMKNLIVLLSILGLILILFSGCSKKKGANEGREYTVSRAEQEESEEIKDLSEEPSDEEERITSSSDKEEMGSSKEDSESDEPKAESSSEDDN